MTGTSRKNIRQRYEKERRRNLLASPGIHEMIIVLDHLKSGYNIPKIFRSAEAFGAHAVHLVGIEIFDPAPAKGSFRKVPARFHDHFGTCHAALTEQDYHLFVLDPSAATPLHKAKLPPRSAFIFGHEEFGQSFECSAYPGLQSLSIPQFGAVESLNVSVAASIVMYEYVRHQMLSGSNG
ncbi:tRNA (guanosine-2'-O-)-methyltransferase [Geoalkalibacter ferrihydriticus]|uniref:tRNA (Guanine-N2)-dimethyltransferase n=2 Tax=Geoalkalibacter ferrihydriticus TaxID=392333 RepID=A0A0C2HNP9_9BACT|nr:TrmH family RNA methyltransferase [Geoalkalibacter ferrihydriticus]KIH76560.1 tRNA (guanine-N2)-dimethyltransferase [Geoalkalibacter ferrihydriticus DSM 17813]SDM01449.1 tRNA (guanosine-2'-O-)-methyltransferase [Geoalkalibacter ferrihydriticus]